jgi:hypothetical protein
MAVIWACYGKYTSVWIHRLGNQNWTIIFEFLYFFQIYAFAIVDIIGPILEAWCLKNILNLPPVIERFADKERCRNILHKVLSHYAIMGIIQVSCNTFLIWWSHFLVCKTEYSLDFLFKFIFTCYHRRVVYGEARIRKTFNFYKGISFLKYIGNRINPWVNSKTACWTAVDYKTISLFRWH